MVGAADPICPYVRAPMDVATVFRMHDVAMLHVHWIVRCNGCD